jgi:hypothetical protein
VNAIAPLPLAHGYSSTERGLTLALVPGRKTLGPLTENRLRGGVEGLRESREGACRYTKVPGACVCPTWMERLAGLARH